MSNRIKIYLMIIGTLAVCTVVAKYVAVIGVFLAMCCTVYITSKISEEL